MASDTGGVSAFSIQGRLYKERERLSFGGMTEAERLLRKQWVDDQILYDCEPVEVPELVNATTNIFKRTYRKPLDFLVYDTLKKVMDPASALLVRKIVGISLTTIGFIYASAYYFKYNQNDWLRKGGVRVITNRTSCLPGETYYHKVKYDPSQEESDDLKATPSEDNSQVISGPCAKPLETENKQMAEESSLKGPCDGKPQGATPDNSQHEVVDNNADNTESNKIDSNVYTSCPADELVKVEKLEQPKIKDKGPLYRSLGSYYASRGFENSPI